jgi:hypothetical protein
VILSLYRRINRPGAGLRRRRRPSLAALCILAGLAPLMPWRFAAAAEPEGASVTAPADATAVIAPALVRVSSSFDVKHASAVLKQVGKLFGAGFVRKDAERVAAEIDALPAEQSKIWEFSAVQKGKAYALRVRARLDEFGDVDLDFFSAPEIASAVRSAVDRYLNARGL